MSFVRLFGKKEAEPVLDDDYILVEDGLPSTDEEVLILGLIKINVFHPAQVTIGFKRFDPETGWNLGAFEKICAWKRIDAKTKAVMRKICK